MSWKEALSNTRGRLALAFCLITLGLMFLLMPAFYREILTPKQGWLLDDWFLRQLNPVDWSLPTFSILYLAIVHTLGTSYKKPDVVILGLTTYCAVNLFRTLTMYCVTLEPPAGMILLRDPISSVLYPDNGFAKDLFFSGHISTIMVVVLIEKNRLAKLLKAAGTVIMAVLLAWQHVHYTLDLVAAPIITYLIFLLVRRLVQPPAQRLESN